MIELIKGFFKIITFYFKELESDYLKLLEGIARVEDSEKRNEIMLKGYKLGYEFETTERICNVSFRMGYDVNILFMGLFRQSTLLLDSCNLSANDINKVIEPYTEIDKGYCNVLNCNYENKIVNQEYYAKAILDHIENKPLEK